ncbi:MAG: UnbV, partial [Chthonomonadales bacterium]|nr:UnbV [Chthonomonadales bacterium]
MPDRSRTLRLSCVLLCSLLPNLACGPHRTSSSSGSGEGSPSVAPGSAAGGAGVHFADVTAAAGISYHWELPAKRPLTILQSIGNGCAFLDYDNDGNLDILLVGPKIALYRGDGKGHFQDVSHVMGLDRLTGHFLGCAIGDYDNDGYVDLYISGYRTGLLLHNERGKEFRDVTAAAGLKLQPWGTSCAFGDIDGDGKLDLYIANYLAFGPQTNPQLCNAYGYQTACGPLSYKPERGALYHNLGGGRFRDVTHAWGADTVSGKALVVAFAPYRPGQTALGIANDEEAGDLLVMQKGRLTNIGVTSGTAYSASGKPQGGMGIDWGDYNNDGQLDLTIATFDDEAKPVYRNTDGLFEDQSQALGVANATRIYVSFGIKWFDFDNDGWLDLAITSGHIADNVAVYNSAHTFRQPSLLLHNLGGTRFEEIGAQTGPDPARPLV